MEAHRLVAHPELRREVQAIHQISPLLEATAHLLFHTKGTMAVMVQVPVRLVVEVGVHLLLVEMQ